MQYIKQHVGVSSSAGWNDCYQNREQGTDVGDQVSQKRAVSTSVHRKIRRKLTSDLLS